MLENQNIFLVGPMGAGKTTIGRHLAAALELQFYDVDHEVETRTGANISWIFDVEGEAGFRQRELVAIDELTQKDHIVLATGGGAILHETNRLHLQSRGQVVYLRASVEQQLERTRRDTHRPLLNKGNPRQILEEMMLKREPLYAAIAHVTINTDRHSPKWVVKEIIKSLNLQNV